MKKIISIVMIAVMLCGATFVPAFAAENTLEQNFYDYCAEKLQESDPPSDGAQVRIIDSFLEGGVTYFTATSWLEPGDMETYEFIGEYCVHSNVWYYPYELGVYVATNDEVYDLKTAFDEGVIKNIICVERFSGISVHYLGEKTEFAELIHTCMDAFARYKNFTPTDNEYVDCVVYGKTEKAVIFRAHISRKDGAYPDICSEQRIGGYIFDYGYVIGPVDNPTGLYILRNGEVIPAPKAYEEGEISISELLSVVSAGADPYNVEDTIVERLGFTEKDGEEPWGPYLYKEQYAYYKNPSSYSANNPDYILVFAADEPGQPIVPSGRIGDYAIVSFAAFGEHYGYYIYIPETDTLYTLTEAVEAQVEGIENAFLHMGDDAGIIGDADKDGRLTVRDATYIQKVLAGIKVENPNAYYDNIIPLIRDFDRNDEVNIKDATAIQKAVAGIKPY